MQTNTGSKLDQIDCDCDIIACESPKKGHVKGSTLVFDELCHIHLR